MKKYLVDPRSWWDASDYGVTARDILVPEEPAPRETGLVNQFGQKIYSVPDRVPFGFHTKTTM